MSTELGLGGLVSSFPGGQLFARDLSTCSIPFSTPASYIHPCKQSRQPSLGAQGACSLQWSWCGAALRDESPHCPPGEGRGLTALPALALPVFSVLFPSPASPLSFLQYNCGRWPWGLPAAGFLEGKKIPLFCFCHMETKTMARYGDVRGLDTDETLPLYALLLFLPVVNSFMAFFWGVGISLSMCQKTNFSLWIL